MTTRTATTTKPSKSRFTEKAKIRAQERALKHKLQEEKLLRNRKKEI